MKVAKYEQNIFSTIQGLRKELGELKEEIGHRKRELSSLNGKIQRRSKKLRESN
jgi:peptidoglycan hydrolase CwlO-like protein